MHAPLLLRWVFEAISHKNVMTLCACVLTQSWEGWFNLLGVQELSTRSQTKVAFSWWHYFAMSSRRRFVTSHTCEYLQLVGWLQIIDGKQFANFCNRGWWGLWFPQHTIYIPAIGYKMWNPISLVSLCTKLSHWDLHISHITRDIGRCYRFTQW